MLIVAKLLEETSEYVGDMFTGTRAALPGIDVDKLDAEVTVKDDGDAFDGIIVLLDKVVGKFELTTG